MELVKENIFNLLNLSEEQVKKITKESLLNQQDGETYLQYSQSENFTFDDGRLKSSSFDITSGFGLRSVNNEFAAYAHSSDTSLASLKRAQKIIEKSHNFNKSCEMDFSPQRTNQKLYIDDNPLDNVPFAQKIKFLQIVDAYARKKDKNIVQFSCSLNGSFKKIAIIRADGEVYYDDLPLINISISLSLKKNERQENGYAGGGGRIGFASFLEDSYWQNLVDKAYNQALINLESKAGPSGEMPVVLGSGWTGILLHEAIGHGLEGDFIRKGTSAFSGKFGEKIATDNVTIIDDGTIKNRRGSLNIDDEGTKTQKTVLVENGRLVGSLLDRQNARLLGKNSTGNGRRQSYSHLPMPRMTNTYMENGKYNKDEIIASVKKGVYAVSFSGGQVDITNGKFVFNCTESYMIEDGKITYPLKNMAMIGDGPTILNYVSMIGNDFELDPGMGVCGKNGQMVPVGVGQPSIKIDKVTIGGTSQ